MNILLTFLYVFCFSLSANSPIDSAMWVFAYLVLYAMFNPQYLNMIVNFCLKKYMRNLVIMFAMIMVWILIVLLMNQSNDTSYIVTFIHMFFQIVTGVFLFLYFRYRGKENEIVNYLIIIFGIQTLIQWMSFLSPTFKEIINLTKSASAIAIGENYGGIRALALTGSNFFGLSAAYAILFLIFFSKKNTLFTNNKVLKNCYYIFVITGTFFAGRTGYVGLACALVYYVIDKLIKKEIQIRKLSAKEIGISISAVGVLGGVIAFFMNRFQYDNRYRILFNFTFQNIFNKINNNTFMTSSLESLTKMYFDIPIVTFIFGDGMYTAENGYYYMDTDVGYMRVILYMGVIGFLLLFCYQLLLFGTFKRGEVIMKLAIIMLLLVLNLKGEAISWGLTIQSIVVLFALQDIFVKDKEAIPI